MDKAKKNLIAYVGNSDNVYIPTTIENLWDFSLARKSMKTVMLPNGLKTIGNGVFQICNSLTNLDIPNSVTSIGLGAFNHCTQLTKVNTDNVKGKISGLPWSNPYGV